MSITIVISHGKNLDFLSYCIKILRSIPILKGVTIWADGCRAENLSDKNVDVSTTHKTRHGVRSFELLNQIQTDIVYIIDSDFFCKDENFWFESINQLNKKILVTISQPWHGPVTIFPSTPFMGFQRKEVLEIIPTKDAWDHFGALFPKVKYPVFDNMKYVFLILYVLDEVHYIDKWNPLKERSFKFFHFWKSIKSLDEKMGIFKDMNKSEYTRYQHLAGMICQKFFEYIIGNRSFEDILNEKSYINDLKQRAENSLYRPYSQLFDFIENMGFQLFEEDKERFENLKQFFSPFIINKELIVKL